MSIGVRGSYLRKSLATEEKAEEYRTAALKYINEALEEGTDDTSTIIESAKRAAAKKCGLESNTDDAEDIDCE